MIKIRDKEYVLNEYERRYPELDKIVIKEVGREYDRYLELLKDVSTREEAMEVFEKEIRKNERNYKFNSQIDHLEGSPHYHYMDILANYGLIVLLRDNMIE